MAFDEDVMVDPAHTIDVHTTKRTPTAVEPRHPDALDSSMPQAPAILRQCHAGSVEIRALTKLPATAVNARRVDCPNEPEVRFVLANADRRTVEIAIPVDDD